MQGVSNMIFFTVIIKIPKRDMLLIELENIAAERMHASDAGTRESNDAALVRAGMKTKTVLGTGFGKYSFFIG
jgi:hypothetical protein